MPHHAPNTARGGASEAETKAYARTHESKYFYNPMTREDRQRAGQGGGKQATLSRDRTEAGERQRMRNRLVAAKQPGRTCPRETAMTEELLPRSCQKETAKAKESPKKTSRREACGVTNTNTNPKAPNFHRPGGETRKPIGSLPNDLAEIEMCALAHPMPKPTSAPTSRHRPAAKHGRVPTTLFMGTLPQ